MTLSSPPTETPDSATQRRGYEARDIHRGSLPMALLAIILGGVIVNMTAYGIYRGLKNRVRDLNAIDSVVSQDAISTGRTLPPLLPEDVRPLREHENEVFEKLGWKTNGNTADVKIPDAVIDALKEQK